MQAGYSLQHLVKASTLLQQLLSKIAMLTNYTLAPGSLGVNVEEIINYMLDNLGERRTLDDFAGRACLSRSHFSRQFREKTGYAPVDYFIRLKIQRACELLESTSLPVRAISVQLGYQDPYYFSRIFKTIVGTHPTEYRQLRELRR
jgi:AraC family transcriptional regulator, arabinose operon regulatory protein